MQNWSAQINVKWNKNTPPPKDWKWLKDWPEVKWAASTMGEWDMTVWVDVDGPGELEDFVWKKLRAKDWVWDTQSTWCKKLWAA